ncbi:MAG: glycosyltransferase [Bacteroidales bacterium]|nr:glycosyltransferase [Bacteroidales bacterium]
MKVTIIGSKGYDTLEYHLADSFRFLGHEAIILDITDVVPIKYAINYHAIKYFIKYDEFLFKKLAKKVIEIKPDLVIGTYRFINPLCIKIIKNELQHIPVIHINPDALTNFEHQQIFASPYDFYFTKDPYIVNFMKQKMDLNAKYLPEAFNPRVHQKPNLNRIELERQTNIDVLAFGSLYPYRASMIKKLVNSGVNVTLFGKKDKRFFIPELDKYFRNEWITGERKAELLFGSKILFNNFHYAEIESVNGKFFESAGIGAFQICDYRVTVNEFSKVDAAKFTFKSINEAIDLIKFYLDKPALRHEMANIQYDHFLQNHTYEHRVRKILETVFK